MSQFRAKHGEAKIRSNVEVFVVAGSILVGNPLGVINMRLSLFATMFPMSLSIVLIVVSVDHCGPCPLKSPPIMLIFLRLER